MLWAKRCAGGDAAQSTTTNNNYIHNARFKRGNIRKKGLQRVAMSAINVLRNQVISAYMLIII